MKKLLIVLAALALLVWVVSWFRTPEVVATSVAQPWPAGLGTLDDAARRFPSQEANEASRKLTALYNAMPKSEARDEFVAREIAKGEMAIGQPPALADVSPIRELVLGEPIVWARAEGIGGDEETQSRRGLVMTTSRALVASALGKARANDTAAWEDLHAAWKIARSLDGHPQVLFQTAALSIARMINAVAWKMPLPAPEWFADVQRRDNLKPLMEAVHHQTASYAKDGWTIFPTKMLADSVDRDRAIIEQVVKETRCDVTTTMNDLGTDLTHIWRRAFRYRAELEATANAIRVREGKPIEEKSVCSDGSWSYDGTTLRFSREIPTPPPDRPMALVLHPGRPR